MKKVKVILNFIRYTATQLIEFARNTVIKMTGNPLFTTPDVAMAQITTAAALLETKYNASRGGGKQQTADMHQARKALEELLRKQVLYVERITMGNESMILSSGFDCSKQPAPALHPEFKVMNGEKEGEIILKHKAVKGAKAWAWQHCTNPIASEKWILAGISTQSVFTIKDLMPGGKYWFRASHITIEGQSEWCDPAVKIVL